MVFGVGPIRAVRELHAKFVGRAHAGSPEGRPGRGAARRITQAKGEFRLVAGKTKTPKRMLRGLAGGSDRRRSGDLSIFSRTLYQLSYRAMT